LPPGWPGTLNPPASASWVAVIQSSHEPFEAVAQSPRLQWGRSQTCNHYARTGSCWPLYFLNASASYTALRREPQQSGLHSIRAKLTLSLIRTCLQTEVMCSTWDPFSAHWARGHLAWILTLQEQHLHAYTCRRPLTANSIPAPTQSEGGRWPLFLPRSLFLRHPWLYHCWAVGAKERQTVSHLLLVLCPSL
jgi:hypothetical protein